MKHQLHTTTASDAPVWTRFPRSGQREQMTGASRATLYRWREAGMITVKHVRRPGQIRGAAFIEVASLMRCIEGGAERAITDPVSAKATFTPMPRAAAQATSAAAVAALNVEGGK
jgi:hypothetical protein